MEDQNQPTQEEQSNISVSTETQPTAGVEARQAEPQQNEWCGQCPKTEPPHFKGQCEKPPAPEPHKIDSQSYKRLPPPIVKHLEDTWGNWLNYISVEMRDWKKDFDDYGVVITVPKEFSTEWSEEKRQVWDNRTRGPVRDENGHPVVKTVIHEDIRVINLKVGTDKVKKWLDRVKANIIDSAFRKGLKLPNTQTAYQSAPSREDYERGLHRV